MYAESAIIRALLQTAPPILDEEMKMEHHCIAATRVGIDALQYWGIIGHPLVVRLLVINDYARRYMEEHGELLQSTDPTYGVRLREGYHVVQVGKTGVAPSGRWDGHLVIMTEVEMIDLTLPKYSRPGKSNIHLAPSSFERPSVSSEGATYETPEGVLLSYTFYGDDNSFRAAPDWRNRSIKHVTGRVIRSMKEVLESE